MAACMMKSTRSSRSVLLMGGMQQQLQLVMQLAAVLMIGVSRLCEVSAGGYTGDTYWSPAHATFYGGDDASGTQGET